MISTGRVLQLHNWGLSRTVTELTHIGLATVHRLLFAGEDVFVEEIIQRVERVLLRLFPYQNEVLQQVQLFLAQGFA